MRDFFAAGKRGGLIVFFLKTGGVTWLKSVRRDGVPTKKYQNQLLHGGVTGMGGGL